MIAVYNLSVAIDEVCIVQRGLPFDEAFFEEIGPEKLSI